GAAAMRRLQAARARPLLPPAWHPLGASWRALPGGDSRRFLCRGSGFGRTEMSKDPLGVVRFPQLAGLAGGVVLVEADEQVGQLTADGLGAQQRGQLGEVDKPVGVPAGPVVVGAIDN